MSILIDRSTRVLVQGITGRDGSFHARSMKAYGTQVVGGVTPGKGGQFVDDMPVFNSVAEGRAATGANATCIFVPAPFAAKAILEAADAGIEFIVAITEGVPVLDMSKVWKALQDKPKTRLLGANCPGLITPGQSKIGIMPGHITTPGPIGLVSRSGTLTYEVVWALTEAGLGQTTCVGIGGDPINGTNFLDVLRMFEADPATKAVVMIGEIGGNDEEVAAEFIRTQMTKPVVGFIAGQTAPPGRRMGHAGAIVTGNSGTAESKIEAFRRAGVPVARITSEIPGLIRQVMAKRGAAKPAPKKATPASKTLEDGAKRRAKASSVKTKPTPAAKAASAKTKATANKAKTAPSGKTAPKAASSVKTTQKSAVSAKRASSTRPAAHGKAQPGRPAGSAAVKTAKASGGSRVTSERSGGTRRASSSQAGTRTETTAPKTQKASRTTVGGRMAKTAAPKKAAKKAAKKSTAKKAAKKATKKATKKVAKKATKKTAKKATKKAVKKVAKKAPAKKAAKKRTAKKAAKKAAKK